MFKKQLAHQGTSTPLRSSARRQLLATIYQQYPALSQPYDGITEKELGKLVLPEGVKSMGIETSGEVEGTLYTNGEGDPLWMTFGRNSKEFIPTLYLLALPIPVPILPIIQLHSPLPPPLYTGAPLFLPAVKNLAKPHLLPDVPEGQVVAFVVSEGDGVRYVAVGRVASQGGTRGAFERRTRNIRERLDREEGRFCDILCIENDHLWDLGSKVELASFALAPPSQPLVPPPESEAGPSKSRTPSPPLVETLSLSDDPGSIPLEPSDISTLLSLALLQTLPNLAPTIFPIPASTLYSAHILPNRPAYIPRLQRDEVVIGKSEWKKLSKWMKEATKEGILKTKETKGEVVILGYDAKHPSADSHVPFTTISQEETKLAKRAAREAASEDTKGKNKEISIEELWKPSPGSFSFWEACGIDTSKTTNHPPTLIKTSLDDYIVKHSLADPRNPRAIRLDEDLGRTVGIKKPSPGETMARDEIMKRLKAGVTWCVSIDGNIRKGTLNPVTLSVKTRQGRKTITHVVGLETFGIDIDDFAEELKKLCAGSASVQPLQGVSPKLNLQEILVQGTQVKIITERLVAKGVPKRWIKEGEGEKKKK
ncbi:translation initiation factor 2D, partial [Tremellales sp. Uapishka_1]